MDSRRKIQLGFVLITLLIANLACFDFFESFICEAAGGEWVYQDYLKGGNYDPTSKVMGCDRNFNQADYDAWKYGSPDVADSLDDVEGDQGDAGEGGLESNNDQPSDQTNTLLECDGSKIVTITVGDPEITKQGHCRYLVHYKSKSASKDVYIYNFDTHTNTSTGKNQEWYREVALFAGNEHSEYQTIFSSGEIAVTERVAIVFTSGVCDWVGTEQEALDD